MKAEAIRRGRWGQQDLHRNHHRLQRPKTGLYLRSTDQMSRTADTTIMKQTWNNKVVVTSDLISVIDILILNTLSMTTKEVADGGQKLRLLRLSKSELKSSSSFKAKYSINDDEGGGHQSRPLRPTRSSSKSSSSSKAKDLSLSLLDGSNVNSGAIYYHETDSEQQSCSHIRPHIRHWYSNFVYCIYCAWPSDIKRSLRIPTRLLIHSVDTLH